jgi:hypothetical protein
MGKIEELEKRQTELEEKLLIRESTKKSKPFKLPPKANKAIKQGSKLGDSIVTQYLTQKGEIKFKVCKIVSGNIIVVNNKAHKLNPKHLWKFGKQMWYIHREIDRNPVSNEDYEEVKERGDDTESDVVLIKAVLGAMMKPKQEIKKGWIVFVIIAIVVAIIAFLFLKKPEEAAAVTPALIGLFPRKNKKKKAL